MTFVVMMLASWRRWTGLIVDFGRETDLPLRLLNGEVLYRDIHYMYGPLSPHFNAFLFRVFGVHVDTLAFSGLALSAIVAFLSYRIARRIMPPVDASLATGFVIMLCLFKPFGPTALPYSFAALHAIVFALAALCFILRYAEHARRRDLVVAGILVGLAGITKQEIALAGALTISLSLLWIHRSSLKLWFRAVVWAALPAILIVVPTFAFLLWTIGWQTLVVDCHVFLTHLPESLIIYNRWRAGLDDPVASLIQAMGSAGVCALVAAAIGLVGDRTGVLRRNLIRVMICSLAVIALVLSLYDNEWDGTPMRILPFLMLGTIYAGWPRHGDTGESNLSRHLVFTVAVFGLALLLRVILRASDGGFATGLTLPVALIILCRAFSSLLPAQIGKWTRDAASVTRTRWAARGFLFVTLVTMVLVFGVRFRRYDYPISTSRGSLFVEAPFGAVVGEWIDFIEDHTAEGEVIAVLPEGNDLAFLTGRRANLRHQVLIPGFLSTDDELDAIAALERDDVRFVFVLNRPMLEFGELAFGRDFYQTLGTWIEDNFELVDVLGAAEGERPEIGRPGFFVRIYERGGKPSSNLPSG